MASLLLLFAHRHGEHLVDRAAVTFLLGVWAAGVLYADFSEVAAIIVAVTSALA